MAKKFEIRNSTAEVLVFKIEGKEDGGQWHGEELRIVDMLNRAVT